MKHYIKTSIIVITMMLISCFICNPTNAQEKKPIKINVIKNITLQTDSSFKILATANPNTKIVFYSKNKDIATVNSKGVIKTIKQGDAIIGVKAYGVDEYRTTYKFIKVHVTRKKQNITTNSIPNVVYTNTTIPINAKAKTTISYKTSNSNIATISNGKIHTTKPGEVTITIKAKGTRKYESKTKKIKIKILQKSSKANAASIENIDTLAPKIPYILKTFIKEMGYTIIVDPSFHGFEGYTDNKHLKVQLRTKKERVIYHEIGHILGFVTGNADMTNAWKQIYENEKNKYKGENKPYAKSDPYEFFAECYKDYILYPTQLKINCPETYKYITQTIKKLDDPKRLTKIKIIANFLHENYQ